MWKAFHTSTEQHTPNAAILFDKNHVIRNFNETLNQIRKSEYTKLTNNQHHFIKKQKYTLLSKQEHLTLEGRQALKTLLTTNKRLNNTRCLMAL